jgi:hypothetical protein
MSWLGWSSEERDLDSDESRLPHYPDVFATAPAQLIERAGLKQWPWRLAVRADLTAGMTAAREAILGS